VEGRGEIADQRLDVKRFWKRRVEDEDPARAPVRVDRVDGHTVAEVRYLAPCGVTASASLPSDEQALAQPSHEARERRLTDAEALLELWSGRLARGERRDEPSLLGVVTLGHHE
jgi:hypothetical protein